MSQPTMLKVLFRLKPGVSLFREKRLPQQQQFKNKLGFMIESRVAILSGADVKTTDDLAALLAEPLGGEMEALAYSDFVLRWQNYFNDLPYCAVLHAHTKDLRTNDGTENSARTTKLDALFNDTIHQAKVGKTDNGFKMERTLGVATREKDGVDFAIWKTQELIQPSGTYRLDLVEKLFDERLNVSRWPDDVPRWFPPK